MLFFNTLFYLLLLNTGIYADRRCAVSEALFSFEKQNTPQRQYAFLNIVLAWF
jgi:hypothetical protein